MVTRPTLKKACGLRIHLRIFIIDIDGTICSDVPNEDGPEKMLEAEPYPDSIEKVNKLYDAGHKICFFTARTEEHRDATERWLNTHGVKYHQVIFGKPRRTDLHDEYHFIDNAHVRATTFRGQFTDFVRKMAMIDSFAD